jgi:hypothetical protein
MMIVGIAGLDEFWNCGMPTPPSTAIETDAAQSSTKRSGTSIRVRTLAGSLIEVVLPRAGNQARVRRHD